MALAGGHPDIATEQIMHTLPRPILPPAPKVLIDELPGRQVVRQQAPRTATTEDIKNGLEDFMLGIFFRSPTGLGWGDQMLNQGPFTVTESGRVWLAGFHAPMLLDVGGPRQSF
jgi:hypothetical protein